MFAPKFINSAVKLRSLWLRLQSNSNEVFAAAPIGVPQQLPAK